MRALLSTALLALLVSATIATAQPDEDESRRLAREYLEAQRDYDMTGIGTSLEDAVTDVAFLDGYNPDRYIPLGEMPRLPGRGYLLVAPGDYQLDAATFCLHAGAFAPGGGDGYALAPLKGMGAELLLKVLEGWATHPEVPQHQIQIIAWAVDERLDPDTLAPEVQATARLLLSEDDWQAWKAMQRPAEPPAIPMVPAEVLEATAAEIGAICSPEAIQSYGDRMAALAERMTQAMNDPDEMERILAEMEALTAEWEQRQESVNAVYERLDEQFAPMLRAQEIISEEMEAAFAPMGDPVPPEGSRTIPATRWSYSPAGYFVRYIPIEGYRRSIVQVAVPGAYSVTRDAEGRIASVVSPEGEALRIAYSGASTPIEGPPGRRRAEIASVTYESPDGPTAWQAGWALLGSPAAADGLPGDVAERATRLTELRAALDRVCAGVATTSGRPAPEPLSDADVADVLDLASLCDAVADTSGFWPITDPLAYWNADGVSSDAPWMEPLYGALQAAIRDTVVAATGPPTDAPTVARRGSPGGAFAPVSLVGAAKASGGAAFSASGGVAQPGNTARQRLGVASTPSPNSVDKSILKKAMEGIDFVKDMVSIATGLMDPVGWLLGKVGLGTGIPSMLLDKLIETIFQMAAQISKALGGDPPRPDYNTFDLPPDIVLPPIEGGAISEERREAAQAVLDAMVGWVGDARRAQVCLDRLGGAAQAGDEEWIWAQARAVVYYKRLTGLRMLAAADAIERLSQVLADEGAESPEWSHEERAAAMDKARSGELSDLDRQAADLLGFSEDEVRAARTARAEGAEGRWYGSYLDALAQLPEPLREAGELWSRLPVVPPPGLDAGALAQAQPCP